MPTCSTDQIYTERQQVAKQPGTCIHCHGSVYVPYKRMGGGDLIKGFEVMNQMPFGEARKHVDHPVACIDCHDPATMQLRVTRPGFLEGIKLVKAKAGMENYDVNTMATRQEMRTYVCGQCHVEYYFKGPEKRLTYPWRNGIKGDEILAYYDKEGFSDWTHAETGAKTLKAQHPEFEMYNQGIHARSGVACADCHMPYQREGGQKVTDHHVRSPVLNINRACQTCHKWPEDELKARAETIQERVFSLRNRAMDALMWLIADTKAARDKGATEAQLEGREPSAAGAVPAGLRRSGELGRLPRAGGSRAPARSLDRPLAPGPDCAAARRRPRAASVQAPAALTRACRPAMSGREEQPGRQGQSAGGWRRIIPLAPSIMLQTEGY